MSDTNTGPGLDAVGLPIGTDGGGAGSGSSPDAFDLGGMFNKVKDFITDNDDKIVQVVVPWLKKKLKLGGQGLEALDLPMSTSITKLVLPSMVARLSPAVKKLTKEDLLALGGWGVPRKLPADLGLTAKDIQTIRDVFTPLLTNPTSLDEEPEAFSLSCCSCTPCCCAAAVTQPVRLVA